MPVVIDPGEGGPVSLAECRDAIDSAGFDPRDAENLAHCAQWLARLGRNPAFLGDLLVAELAHRHRDDVLGSGYGPQVVMLAPPNGTCFMRANIWPSAREHAVRATGEAAFVYGLPHDHNFDFLTCGYFGPGYWSDYYEADYDAIVGWRGEPVPSLRFVERARLHQGQVLHYRAHRDIHAQIPPDDLSVSLNIMHATGIEPWFDQYRYDLDRGQIGAIVAPGPTDAFVRIALALGSAEAIDLGERFARHHPSDRLRLAAWDGLAARAADVAARDEVWRRAEATGSPLVSAEAKRRRSEMA